MLRPFGFILILFSFNALAQKVGLTVDSKLQVKTFKALPRCVEELSGAPIQTKDIVNFFVNRANQRRPGDFPSDISDFSKRLEKAYKHAHGTSYIYALKPGTQELAATFGLEFSDYGVGIENVRPLLNEEVFGEPVRRPISKFGGGFVVEGVVYATDDEVALEAPPLIFKSMLELMQSRLAQMPDLKDQEIVYTYGPAKSVYFYRVWGFRKVSEQPKVIDGIPMWKLVATPRSIERGVERFHNLTSVYGFEQILRFHRPGGEARIGLKQGGAAFFLNKEPHRNISHIYGLAEPTPLGEGVAGDAGSAAILLGGSPLYVERLALPFPLKFIPAFALPGREISFYPDGSLMTVGGVDRDVEIADGVWARKGSPLSFLPDHSIVINSIAKPVMDSNGSILPVDSSVKLIREIYGTTVIGLEPEAAERREFQHESIAAPFGMTAIFDCESPSGAKIRIYGPTSLDQKSEAMLGYFTMDLSEALKGHPLEPIRLSVVNGTTILFERFHRKLFHEVPVSGGMVDFDRKWGEASWCTPLGPLLDHQRFPAANSKQ